MKCFSSLLIRFVGHHREISDKVSIVRVPTKDLKKKSDFFIDLFTHFSYHFNSILQKFYLEHEMIIVTLFR